MSKTKKGKEKEKEPTALELLNEAEMEKERLRAIALKRVQDVWARQVKTDLERERKRLAKKAAEWKKQEQERVDKELYFAARTGILSKVESLVVDQGAVNGAYRDGDSDTAYTIAQKSGHTHIVEWFDAGGETNRRGLFEQNTLNEALFTAARDSNVKAARQALVRGAEPDGHRNFWGVTALHKAVVRKKMGGLPMMQLLLEAGAEVNHVDGKNGFTPLHKAASLGLTDHVHWLILHGGLFDVQDFNGCTPLHLATDHGHLQTVQLLVNHGANIRIKDNVERTPADLALARDYEDIIDFLCGVPWNIAETRADRKLIFKAAMEKANAGLRQKEEDKRRVRAMQQASHSEAVEENIRSGGRRSFLFFNNNKKKKSKVKNTSKK